MYPRFVSTGLCVLVAVPQLIAGGEGERRVMEWLRWTIEGGLGVQHSSLGSLLLLLAIHMHTGQTGAVLDLVSSALGLKV